ncbi:MAG: DUF1566 domain-containing protein [Myxococcaceae bacterium]|nr:DUF1566 domain-containing protein [Myxococcaceae bacterium]MBH2006763.1 DUF1566 domain-containing protein [Myxococcaceae bacterium]
MGNVFKLRVFSISALCYLFSFGLLAQPWNYSAYEDGTHQSGRYVVDGESQNSFIVHDRFTGLSWEQSNSTGNVSWSSTAARGSAQSYCSRLRKGNYADWRIPSVTELQSLMDYTRINTPMMNQEIFSAQENQFYWTSMARANLSDVAWVFDFKLGALIDVLLEDPGIGVRCVRGKRMQVSERYVDEQNGSITKATKQIKDRVTGLIWQRNAFYVRSLREAHQYCNNLFLEDKDWRLPSIKMLATLVDYSRSRPSIQENVFPKTLNDYFWSSSTPGIRRIFWHILFSSGSIDTTREQSFSIRCVRKE